jgi:hypothetical protein
MAKPTDFFGGMFKALQDFWNSLVSEFNKTLFLVDVLKTLQDDVKAEAAEIVNEIKGIETDTNDFIERAKHIKTHVIRVDVAINLVNDIRDGKLKDFVSSLRDEFFPKIQEMLQIVHDTTQQFSSLSKITNISGVVIKLISVWSKIEEIVKVIAGVVPILQQIHDKLTELESSILQQSNPRATHKGKARVRVGKLHASA